MIDPTAPSRLVERALTRAARKLEAELGSDVLAFFGPIYYGVDDAIRDALETRRPKRARLAILLETDGGYIEVAQRIADTIRHHYNYVDFFVPDHAMSAGTVLVMSGDAIHMDYYSILGPIDPQVETSDGRRVPALGYLEKFAELVAKSKNNEITTAEMAYLVQRFDPAELHQFEQARELSKTLLKEWLTKWKFKDWNTTEARGLPVSQQMKEQRASEIAEDLNNTKKWHTHSRGITMAALAQIKLKIDDFGKNPKVEEAIRHYYRPLAGYMAVRSWGGLLHSPGRLAPLGDT